MKKIIRKSSLFIFTVFSAGTIQALSQCDDPFIVNLGNDTVICEGGVLYLDAGVGLDYLWNDGSTGKTLVVMEEGIYFVSVTNECDQTDSDTINVEVVSNPVLNIQLPSVDYFCKGELVNVIAEIENPISSILYNWSNSSTNESVTTIDTTGVYNLTVTDEYGCQTQKEFSLEFQYPYEEEKILLVSYDPEEDKNIIIYSRTENKRTMEYEIYNGLSFDDKMKVQDFDAPNIVIDDKTDPHLEARYYNLMVKDSCENLSAFKESRAHKSMHLGITDDKEANIKLDWSAYSGFEYNYFYILRGSSENEMLVVDSVAYSEDEYYSWTDKSAEDGAIYYYQLRIKTPETIFLENSTDKKAGSGPFIYSLSNLEDKKKTETAISDTDYLMQFFKVVPNPVSNTAIILYKLEDPAYVCLDLYNILGKKISSLYQGIQIPGNHETGFNAKEYNLSKGLYFLRLNIENQKNLSLKFAVQ